MGYASLEEKIRELQNEGIGFENLKYTFQKDTARNNISKKGIGRIQSVKSFRIYQYLNKNSKIPLKIIQMLNEDELIYQDNNENLVFPCYDAKGMIRGALLYSIPSELRAPKRVSGSEIFCGWKWSPGITSDFVTVVNHTIDAMSLSVLYPENMEGHFLALGELHIESIDNFINSRNIKKIMLALNNDEKSKKAASHFGVKLSNDYPYTFLPRILPLIKRIGVKI